MFDDDWWTPRPNEAYDPEWPEPPDEKTPPLKDVDGYCPTCKGWGCWEHDGPEPEEEDYCVECAGSGWALGCAAMSEISFLFADPGDVRGWGAYEAPILDPCPSCKGSGEP